MNSAKTIKVVSIILNLPFEHVRQALASHACLHRTGLVSLQSYNCYLNNKLNLVSNQMVDKLLMYNHDVMDLFAGTINKSTPAELLLADYAHLDQQLNLLLAYLKQAQHQQQSAINIFLYGSSGTGKTQLCKVLAAELNLDLYEISCEDEDGDPVTATERLCAYRAAQNIFKSQAALLMFDEVEDVFNDAENGAGMKSTAQSRKAWINRMLENNPSPTIWVSNSDELDPAFVRRFDMVLEVKVPPKKQRMTMIKQYCPSDFDDHYHEALANVEHLSPAVLRRTYRVAQTAKRSNEQLNVQDSMTKLISSTLKAQGHQPFKLQNSDALPQFYDLSFIHTKANLSQIATGMKQHGFGRLCLYGPSGTGKTAFARWMAEYTAQPLFIKRGSDILSPWVGEMEQNLAKAFAQAEEQNAILLLDEVDSLLQDRTKATRSWEISQVNEFLVQLESFNGIVITTTNRFDDLDQAALRRFDFKIHFDYLTYAQRFKLLQQVCQQLGLSVEEQQVRDQLKRLNCLCAGDFSVIVRQSFFHPFTDVDAVLHHLASEMEVKLKKSPAIGFNIPA